MQRAIELHTALAVMLAVMLEGVLAGSTSVRAQLDPSWRQPFDPVRIVGNIYYVGTRGLSSFLIVTPADDILIDSGEPESVPFIRANVERLAFRMSDIRILLTGHAHFDHVGGHADMKRLTGALVMVMEADRGALASGVDRSAYGGPGWKRVPIDRVLKDGETVSLGSTPINDGVHLVGNTRVPQIADQYAQAFRVLHGLTPDVFVGQHGAVFGLVGKAEKAGRAGQPNPFVDPDGYRRWVDRSERTYLTTLRQEQKR